MDRVNGRDDEWFGRQMDRTLIALTTDYEQFENMLSKVKRGTKMNWVDYRAVMMVH